MPFVDLVLEGELARVRAAIDAGAPIDGPDERGLTPLMVACREGLEDVAALLIERGARLDAVGPLGESPLGFAMRRCPSIAERLVELGVLGRPLRVAPLLGELAPSDCDVCTRYADVIEIDRRPSATPVRLAWLEIVEERRSSHETIDRSLRCTCCGTRYEHRLSLAGRAVTETIRRRPGPPSALVGALFISEDERLVCQLVRSEPFSLVVWAGLGGSTLLRAHTRWHLAKAPRSERAHDRLDHLVAELGIEGVGETYTLFVTRKNPDHSVLGDKEWISALPDTPLDELRLFPQHGSSPYISEDLEEEWWWTPYSTFRPATATEREVHSATKPSRP